MCRFPIEKGHNNLGIVRTGGPVELSEETWDLVVTVNLKTLFLAAKYVLPIMEKQRYGVITTIGSMAGYRYTGLPMIAYATTKGAIPAFTRTIAMQYAAAGIRANSIHPGVIDTPMQRATTDDGYAAVFLASDDAAYITGVELMVDGGFIQRAG
jgi:NAD(P)-dependent dehydrogenase (short-subunit alcohol dehydrogenase family)